MRFFKSLLVLLAIVLSAKAHSQNLILSESAEVSVLTCGNGNELYSLFGHTAIRIVDRSQNLDIVYNYGAFDFDTPNFVVRFSKGDLQYFVTAGSFQDFLYSYEYDKRSVVEQTLSLTSTQKQALFDTLSATLISDDRFYTYKFIDRNCTTMVVDLLNNLLGSTVLQKVDATDLTYREVLYPYFDHHFYEQLGTSIIFGTKVDQQANKIFLPIELYNSIEKAAISGENLQKSNRTWLKYDQEKKSLSWWNNVYSYIILLLLLVIANRNTANMIFFAVAGLIGTFFMFAGFYSFHGELANNYNALLFNPALLLLVVFFYMRKDFWFYRTAIFCLASIGIYLFFVLGKVHFLIVVPLLITLVLLLSRYCMYYKKHRTL